MSDLLEQFKIMICFFLLWGGIFKSANWDLSHSLNASGKSVPCASVYTVRTAWHEYVLLFLSYLLHTQDQAACLETPWKQGELLQALSHDPARICLWLRWTHLQLCGEEKIMHTENEVDLCRGCVRPSRKNLLHFPVLDQFDPHPSH